MPIDLNNTADWMLLLSGGALIWCLTYFDKFVKDKKLKRKWIYTCAMFFLFLSSASVAVSKLNLMLGFNLFMHFFEVDEAVFIAWGIGLYIWAITFLAIYVGVYIAFDL